MRSIRLLKYKYLKLALSCLALLLPVFAAPVIIHSPAALAAIPSCVAPAKLVEASNGEPDSDYCSCPNGGYIVTSSTGETCVNSCPSGTVATSGTQQSTCETPSAVGSSSACATNSSESFCTGDETTGSYQCGSGSSAVRTSIDFGCKGETCAGNCSAVLDVSFAIIRFLSYGVGLIVVGSIVVAGIQYTSSRGDPKAVAAAQTRLRSTVVALLLYIFGYAILNYIIPAKFFNL